MGQVRCPGVNVCCHGNDNKCVTWQTALKVGPGSKPTCLTFHTFPHCNCTVPAQCLRSDA